MNQQHLYCFRTDLAPAVPSAHLPARNVRRIFISDLAVAPGGGVAAADAECVADAKAGGHPNVASFISLLATSTTPASKRVNINGRAVDAARSGARRRDAGRPRRRATSSRPSTSLADGATYKNPPVWTGAVDPATAGDATCTDWTSAADTVRARYGYPNSASIPDWFSSGQVTCDTMYMNLICIEP